MQIEWVVVTYHLQATSTAQSSSSSSSFICFKQHGP